MSQEGTQPPGKYPDTSGGTTIGQDVNTAGGNFVGRDFVQHIHYHMTPPHSARLPEITPDQPVRIFIGYKRHTPTMADQSLAKFLKQHLEAQEHEVFIDLTMRTGEKWLAEIDEQIKNAHFFIALLSADSVQSEMLQSEIHRAYQYRQQNGRPFILPVRMAFDEMLPYAIDAFLNPFQYVSWISEADSPAVASEILDAIQGNLPDKEVTLAQLQSPGAGQIDEPGSQVRQPLPVSDPRILKRLRAPGGALRLSDQLYVERPEDQGLREALTEWGETVTIRAPRQSGKTSMLIRGVHYAEEQGLQAIFLDFQAMGSRQLAHKESFIRILADKIAFELDIPAATVDGIWALPLGDQDKLTQFMQKFVLSEREKPLILAIDEADQLLRTDYYQDMFGLIRSWHNRRARHEEWELLNMVLVISTEPYLLIDDVNQSPFNVGVRLEPQDFSFEQITWLNAAHDSPLGEEDLKDVHQLLGGQPFLLRKLFYVLLREGQSWPQINALAAEDNGPFGDHLRRQLWALQDQPELVEALQQLLRHGRSEDNHAVYRLMRAGLIMSSGQLYRCRCQLYERYFSEKLKR